MSYTPSVSVDVSPAFANSSLLVQKFKDTSPDKDKRHPIGGTSVTNNHMLANTLDVTVTNAIVTDLAYNKIFSTVDKKIDQPDFIMKGEIKKFKGVAGLFGNGVDIELVVQILDSEGKLIGVYSGSDSSSINQDIGRRPAYSLPHQTNRSFSKAWMDIRKGIIGDIHKFRK